MSTLLKNILREIYLRFYPFRGAYKSTLLYDKWIKPVRFKGKGIKVNNNIDVVRRLGLMIGQEVELEGKNRLDATAGIMLGDKVQIKKGVQISTQKNNPEEVIYAPVVVGAGNIVERNLVPGTILDNKISVKGLSDFEGQIIFVLGTGRSGSNAIVKLFNQHPDIRAYHDSFPPIYTWSCQKLYKQERDEVLLKNIKSLYDAATMNTCKVHLQSDQKLAPLVPILARLYPQAKFVWLIRHAASFVNSSYPRGWFQDQEFGYKPTDKALFFPPKVQASPFNAAHRTNGALVGEFSLEEWKAITPFERNCWYWSYWNQLIASELSKLPTGQSMQIKLEELEERIPDLLGYMGIKKQALTLTKTNQAYYQKLEVKDWTPEMKNILKNIVELH